MAFRDSLCRRSSTVQMQDTSTMTFFLIFFPSFLVLLCPVSCLSNDVICDTTGNCLSNNIICDSTGNFAVGSVYEKNRNITLTSLVANASVSRFAALRVGEEPDAVYGLMRCRAYNSMADCRTCVDASAKDLVHQCMNQKTASGLYEHCSLQYSDSSFFLIADDRAKLTWGSPNNASDTGKFDSALRDLMSKLLRNASASPLRIAAGNVAYTNSASIHGMVQCAATLDDNNCSKCLQAIIAILPNPTVCPEKDGCRVVSLGCDLRYEDFPFAVNYENPPLLGSNSTIIPPSKRGSFRKSTAFIVATSAVGALAVICTLFSCFFCVWRRKNKKEVLERPFCDTHGTGERNDRDSSDQRMKPLSISFRTLKTATSNFSGENKLGEGSFGPVYKGLLSDGRQIAVKRLSSSSAQGIQELKTEVLLVAKLLHRNLVRLIGFCLEQEEKLLVYEFLPNGSLDKVLFDHQRRRSLDWEKRYRIIVGIARGLLYLHEDSQMRIIHRDLKAGNILLDQDMNPKISDFGIAKLFPGSQTEGMASRIAGTYGYMAPEYIVNGHCSTKCDVYSYGVLVLEIVTGRKNSSIEGSINLPNHAWEHWTNGTALELVDPTLDAHWPRNKVLKCIQIGLLCAQDLASDRPAMTEVVSMLNTYNITNPAPKRPAFFPQPNEGSGGPQREQRNQSCPRGSTNEVTISELDPR